MLATAPVTVETASSSPWTPDTSSTAFWIVSTSVSRELARESTVLSPLVAGLGPGAAEPLHGVHQRPRRVLGVARRALEPVPRRIVGERRRDRGDRALPGVNGGAQVARPLRRGGHLRLAATATPRCNERERGDEGGSRHECGCDRRSSWTQRGDSTCSSSGIMSLGRRPKGEHAHARSRNRPEAPRPPRVAGGRHLPLR